MTAFRVFLSGRAADMPLRRRAILPIDPAEQQALDELRRRRAARQQPGGHLS